MFCVVAPELTSTLARLGPVARVVVELACQALFRHKDLDPVVARCKSVEGVGAVLCGTCTVAPAAAVVGLGPHLGIRSPSLSVKTVPDIDPPAC